MNKKIKKWLAKNDKLQEEIDAGIDKHQDYYTCELDNCQLCDNIDVVKAEKGEWQTKTLKIEDGTLLSLGVFVRTVSAIIDMSKDD